MSNQDSSKPITLSADKVTIVEPEITSNSEASDHDVMAVEKNLPVSNKPMKSESNQNSVISRLKRWFLPATGALIVVLSVIELVETISYWWSENIIIGGLIGGLALVSVGALLAHLLTMFRGKRRLTQRSSVQERFKVIATKSSYGRADSLLKEISTQLPKDEQIQTLITNFSQQRVQMHNDKELIELYSSQVLTDVDHQAIEIITKHSFETAMMVTLSPLAVTDMALVIWKTQKMTKAISELYGCPTTAFSRYHLSRMTIKNMMLAGASELAVDAWAELLGQGLLTSLSGKAAQGVGIGLLVAKYGLETIDTCRPIALESSEKLKLSAVRKQLIGQLKTTIGTSIFSSSGSTQKEEQLVEKDH